jgi:hypothetical protein
VRWASNSFLWGDPTHGDFGPEEEEGVVPQKGRRRENPVMNFDWKVPRKKFKTEREGTNELFEEEYDEEEEVGETEEMTIGPRFAPWTTPLSKHPRRRWLPKPRMPQQQWDRYYYTEVRRQLKKEPIEVLSFDLPFDFLHSSSPFV